MEKKILRNIITSVDVSNTLNGGRSEPFLSLQEKSSGREMRVRVPGVNRDLLQVEISNDELSVYYLVPINCNGKLTHVPQIVYNQDIPYFIEASRIKATYDENELVVNLPFKLSSGYNQTTKIKEE